MGDYREAVNALLNGTDPTPDITKHEYFGAIKYGFGCDGEQELTQYLRVGARFGWNEGQHESFAYTEVDQTVLVGVDYRAAINGVGEMTRLGWLLCQMPSSEITKTIWRTEV